MTQLTIRCHPGVPCAADELELADALRDMRLLGLEPKLLDADSSGWLRALSATGPARDDAVERLHELLLRAARSEVGRRQAVTGRGAGDLDDLAVQAADDALVALLGKLHTYRGAGRFTTWAYKFALREAAARLRRRAWISRELPPEADGWARLPDAIRNAIAEELTPHQRAVLVALTLNDVPIDVLAERKGTTRGALYKTLHDSRRRLRARLASDGHLPDPAAETEIERGGVA